MKMLFRSLALSLAAFALPAVAQDAAPAAHAPPPAGTAAAAPVVPALWKIADEDTTIYLFGTIHVLPKGIDWYEGKVASAFADSGELVTEIIGGDPAKMQALVAEKALLPTDQSLRGLLSDKQKAAYEAALAQYNIPPALFDRFELWYAAIALSTMPLMQEGFATENGVEEQLDARARARNLPHEGLETPEYQLSLFDGLPANVQRSYLSEVIDQLPTIKTDLKAMVEAWKQGNAEELARLMNQEESDPVLVKTLLIDRNKAWADWIAKRLNEPGTVFVAVGAGHLAGAGSVQEQLSAEGVASERIQ